MTFVGVAVYLDTIRHQNSRNHFPLNFCECFTVHCDFDQLFRLLIT